MLLWLAVLLVSFAMLVDGIRRLEYETFSDRDVRPKFVLLFLLELVVFVPVAVGSTLKLQDICPRFAWGLGLILMVVVLEFGTIIYTARQRRIAKQGGATCG